MFYIVGSNRRYHADKECAALDRYNVAQIEEVEVEVTAQWWLLLRGGPCATCCGVRWTRVEDIKPGDVLGWPRVQPVVATNEVYRPAKSGVPAGHNLRWTEPTPGDGNMGIRVGANDKLPVRVN